MTSMALRHNNPVLTQTRSHVVVSEGSMPVVSPAQEASPQADLALKISAPYLEVGGALEALSPIYSSSCLETFRVSQVLAPVLQLGVPTSKRV